MADPRQIIPTLTGTIEDIAAQMGTSPSRRALRSTNTGIASSTSSPAEKPSAPPALPGKKSTKRILFDQIEAVDDAPEQPPQDHSLLHLARRAIHQKYLPMWFCKMVF